MRAFPIEAPKHLLSLPMTWQVVPESCSFRFHYFLQLLFKVRLTTRAGGFGHTEGVFDPLPSELSRSFISLNALIDGS